jgi:hypothetical protein
METYESRELATMLVDNCPSLETAGTPTTASEIRLTPVANVTEEQDLELEEFVQLLRCQSCGLTDWEEEVGDHG